MGMIRITEDICKFGLNVYIFKTKNDRPSHILNNGIYTPINERSLCDPTLFIDRCDVKDLIDQLAELDLKSDNDHKIQGVLLATKEHLEDLRHLLKLPQKNENHHH